MKAVISEDDYIKLEKLLLDRKTKLAQALLKKLQELKKVPFSELDKRTVRINSKVELWHNLLQKNVKFQVVSPEQADLKKRKLSAFAPVSMAILGHSEGATVEISDAAKVRKSYKILKVIND